MVRYFIVWNCVSNLQCICSDGLGGGGGGGGGSHYGGFQGSGSKRDFDDISLPKQDFENLTPFEKNFYVETLGIACMTEDEVKEYHNRREITIDGRDIPKPVKSFGDAGFPGILIFLLFIISHLHTILISSQIENP